MLKTKKIYEIQEILCDQIDRLREGKSTPAEANAIMHTTGKFLSTIKMQLDYYKSVGEMPVLKGLLSIPVKEKSA